MHLGSSLHIGGRDFCDPEVALAIELKLGIFIYKLRALRGNFMKARTSQLCSWSAACQQYQHKLKTIFIRRSEAVVKGFFCFIIGMSVLAPAHAFSIYRSGQVVEGEAHNDVIGRWMPRHVSLYVGISGEAEYLIVRAETGLGVADAMMEPALDAIERLQTILSKAISWSDIARKNKADTTKILGCLGGKEWDVSHCERYGKPEEGQVAFTFFSARGGKYIRLILDIIDEENQFKKAQIYLDLIDIKQLREAATKADAVLNKARERGQKDHLFK